jgi:ribonuclease T1
MIVPVPAILNKYTREMNLKHTRTVCPVGLFLLLIVCTTLLVGCGAGEAPSAASPAPGATPAAASTVRATPIPERIDGFPVITRDELPPEALVTIDLIERDGPFPYRQDGAVFQNRERLLPRQPQGYYHEYTVETPGESDRGARRIVTGEGGEMYYTDDHYASFERIAP